MLEVRHELKAGCFVGELCLSRRLKSLVQGLGVVFDVVFDKTLDEPVAVIIPVQVCAFAFAGFCLGID